MIILATDSRGNVRLNAIVIGNSILSSLSIDSLDCFILIIDVIQIAFRFRQAHRNFLNDILENAFIPKE